jgi:hypothetical protein
MCWQPRSMLGKELCWLSVTTRVGFIDVRLELLSTKSTIDLS